MSLVKRFMDPVDVYYKAIQGKDTRIPEQIARLDNLANHLKSAIEISDPLDAIELHAVAGYCTAILNGSKPEEKLW